MANSRLGGTSISTAPHEWRRQFHRGWIDAQNGRDWPRDYDTTMSQNEQISYEQGRLLVREAMAEGFGLCVWRGDKAGSKPVEQLWSHVRCKLGRNIIPPTWVEEQAMEVAA